MAASLEKAARAAYDRAAIKELATFKSGTRRVDLTVTRRFRFRVHSRTTPNFVKAFFQSSIEDGWLDKEVWRGLMFSSFPRHSSECVTFKFKNPYSLVLDMI